VELYNLDPDRISPAHYSRHCRHSYFADIERMEPAEALACLKEVHGDIRRKAILIPTTDATAQFVEQWRTELRNWFLFPDQPAGLARALCSKKEMYFVATRHGIPTPQCCCPESRADLSVFLETAKFPVMLKGIHGHRLWERTGKKMFIARNADELIEKYEMAEDPRSPNLMLQEYIPGGDDTVWMYNGYFNLDSNEIVGFTGKKLRQSPIHTGCTTLGVCLRNDEVSATTKRFMKALGYRGILDIGYRYDARDGRYKVLDVNPRIGATFRLFCGANGMDVVRALYLNLTGQPVPSSTAVEGRKWIVEDLDLLSSYRYFREGGFPLGDWLKSYRGIDETAFLSGKDPVPVFFMALSRCRDVVSRLRRRGESIASTVRRTLARAAVNPLMGPVKKPGTACRPLPAKSTAHS
jgi:predicted ATP-grasp superfamily ATP-dependent carboligase